MTEPNLNPGGAMVPKPLEMKRSEDFKTIYANHIVYEQSAWDLRLIFGQVELESGVGIARQNVAITIPWPQAKLALFWLRLQVEAAEAEVGSKIPIRKDVLPVELPAPAQGSDPAAVGVYRLYKRIRDEFIASIEGTPSF